VKVSSVTAALIVALGLGLLIWGTASTSEVTLLGMTFHPRIAKSVGAPGSWVRFTWPPPCKERQQS
jgi:hypothetical protein